MGKGLSDLQNAIVIIAQENIKNEPRRKEHFGADIYSPEVLQRFYGFPVKEKYSFNNPASIRDRPTNWHFSVKEIGEKKYRAAISAVSRAMRRLEKRKLLERFCLADGEACANLTDKGKSLKPREVKLHPANAPAKIEFGAYSMFIKE